MAKSSNTSPRSYTLRLQGTAENDLWREHLWRTHVAVNRGAKVFGDFLLTFCGGIAHRLADVDADGNALSGADRKNRRIILALSWLSVEDKSGASDAQYHLPSNGTEM